MRADFDHDRGYLCNDAGTDPTQAIAFDPSTCDVDHIVAAQEAFESGAWAWDTARRMAFGNDAENLIATRDCVNRSKGRVTWPNGQDGSEAACAKGQRQPLTDGASWLTRWCKSKAAYSLSVDQDEKTALTTALETAQAADCLAPGGESFTGTIEVGSGCHPAYSPCLPNLAVTLSTAATSHQTRNPVTVLVLGVDPYRLDRDGDGRGCTS